MKPKNIFLQGDVFVSRVVRDPEIFVSGPGPGFRVRVRGSRKVKNRKNFSSIRFRGFDFEFSISSIGFRNSKLDFIKSLSLFRNSKKKKFAFFVSF